MLASRSQKVHNNQASARVGPQLRYRYKDVVLQIVNQKMCYHGVCEHQQKDCPKQAIRFFDHGAVVNVRVNPLVRRWKKRHERLLTDSNAQSLVPKTNALTLRKSQNGIYFK